MDRWKIAYNVEDYPELKQEDKFQMKEEGINGMVKGEELLATKSEHLILNKALKLE